MSLLFLPLIPWARSLGWISDKSSYIQQQWWKEIAYEINTNKKFFSHIVQLNYHTLIGPNLF